MRNGTLIITADDIEFFGLSKEDIDALNVYIREIEIAEKG